MPFSFLIARMLGHLTHISFFRLIILQHLNLWNNNIATREVPRQFVTLLTWSIKNTGKKEKRKTSVNITRCFITLSTKKVVPYFFDIFQFLQVLQDNFESNLAKHPIFSTHFPILNMYLDQFQYLLSQYRFTSSLDMNNVMESNQKA